MKVLYRLFTLILFTSVLSSCAPDLGEQKKKYRDVSLSMDYSNPSSRSTSKINENLLMGIGTEVIYVVSDSVGFDDNYQNLLSYEDRALTDTSNNKVSLTLPLDTSLKVYAYRFAEKFTLNDLDGQSKTPISYGKSGSFILFESTSSLTISLSITPNGIPSLEITTPTVSIDNQGGNATFTVKLKTQPKETVTLPISIDNNSIATLSSSSISFTPLNWNTSQTVTLTGNTSTNYSDNVTLKTSLGPTTSEDVDYVNLNSSFTLSSTGYPFTPDNLTALSGDGIVNLDWNPVANATGYNIYYDGMSSVTSSDTLVAGVTDDNYTLSGLPNNTPLYFRVASINSNGISALSSEVSATPTADNLSRGLVAFYRFNGNANDNTTNSNHGTVNGATLTTGKDNVSNTAYSFDGTNDKIMIANHSLFNFEKNDNLSFSVWVYPESFVELNGIFSKYQSASDDDLFLRVNDSNGGLKFGSGLGSIIISNALNLNQWQNIGITIDNGSTQLFINGVLKGSGTTSWNQTVNYFSIGCDYCVDGSSDTRRFFDGKIDKLRIYNRLLNSTEITSLYSSDNTSVITSSNGDNSSSDNISRGLVAFYRFNGNANDNTSNANHGTISGATLTTGKDNVSNTAYSFDGTDDFIELPAGLLSGSGDFSVSLWVKTSSSTESRILQQRDANGFNGEYMLDLKSNGKLKLQTYKNGYKWEVTTTSSINDSNWHQICFIQKDNGGSLYLDGALEVSDNTSGTVNLLSLLKTYLGGDKRDNNRFFSGNVDKLRIYNRSLTNSEINSLYTSDNTTSLGEWVYWNLDDSSGSDNISSRDLSITGTPSIDNGTWSLTGNGTYGQYQLNANDNLSNFSVSLRIKIASDAERHDSLFSSNTSSTSGSWQIGMTGDNSIKFSSKQSSGANDSGDLSLSKNTWHHIVLTKSNSNEIKLYKNNSLAETLQLNAWSLNFLRIGTNRNTTNTWKGNIDDVRVYDYVLSVDNINTLYQIY